MQQGLEFCLGVWTTVALLNKIKSTIGDEVHWKEKLKGETNQLRGDQIKWEIVETQLRQRWCLWKEGCASQS
jgi:hypothetical protein